MFIQPMVTIAIYAFIFGEHGMKNAPPVPGATYVIWLTPGIIPWFYFSEILNTGTNCLQEYHYLVKKVVFQVEMLPVIKLISCFLVHACFLIIMAAVSYTIRVLPLTLIRKPIKNQFIQSFLYYVPYVTLAVMTFPAIIHATQTPISGLVALIAGIIAAWLGAGLFPVSVICCALVFLIELFI